MPSSSESGSFKLLRGAAGKELSRLIDSYDYDDLGEDLQGSNDEMRKGVFHDTDRVLE